MNYLFVALDNTLFNLFTDTIFLLLGVVIGTIVSLYATVVFERYKRFREVLMEIGRARQHNEGYPMSTNNLELERAHEKAMEFWRLLESNQWILRAEGHHEAGAQVGRLMSFAYRTNACIENMLFKKPIASNLSMYLSAFQSEFIKIKDENYIQFELSLKPSLRALLKPSPNPFLPTSSTIILVDYFDKLL